MYDIADTIVAISSPSGGIRSVVRISGPQAIAVCEQVFQPGPDCEIRNLQSDLSDESAIRNPCILSGSMRITDALTVDARLYLFFAPRSYTGEHLVEIHIDASQAIVEALVENLLAAGLRPAGPGEFTARAYLNGKLDLAQAEAVNEIVSSSNHLQLDAAQRLLGGRLTDAADGIRSALLDILSLIEAGLDFSEETQDIASAQSQVLERLEAQTHNLASLLAGSIRCEALMDLPAIGIAGAPNAGKSSLLNALLGWERSIVSGQPKTTRDVLTGVLTTDRFQCVLFDCAGLLLSPDNTLDELTQRAAIEALQNCHAVLFCVDSAKPDWREDIAVRALIEPKHVVHVATKCDLLPGDELPPRIRALTETFKADFLPTSATTAQGHQELLDAMAQAASRNPQSEMVPLVLTARHRQAIVEAGRSVGQAVEQIRRGNDEIAATMIRAACQAVSHIEQQHIDEQVLDRIFSRFCIGK